MNFIPSALIVDSHQFFGPTIESMVAEANLNHRIIVFDDLRGALEELQKDNSIRLAIVDLSTLGVNGTKTVRFMRDHFLHLLILTVCGSQRREVILNCLAHGAHGVVIKTQPKDEIIRAINVVLNGEIYVPACIAKFDLNNPDTPARMARIAESLSQKDLGASSAGEAPPDVHLSRQQREVLRLLASGLSNKSIAQKMQLAEGTVKVHINSVFKALNVNSRTQAILKVLGPQHRPL